ncbi:MAG: CPBP family intramembrane glutamic endopeptidase [Chthoniobacterales bacterium]
MKGLRALFTNPFFLGAIALLIASLVVLSRGPEFDLGEKLLGLVLLGIAFPLLAWLALLRARPLSINVHPSGNQMLGLALYIIALSVYLAVGPQMIDSWLPQSWVESERIHFFIKLAKKLLVFVFIPFALFGPPCRCSWGDFGLQWASFRECLRSHLPVILLVGAAFLAFQYFFGGGAAPLRRGELSARQLVIGLPLAFVWLAIEAGLVEEFFFRGLLQARLSAWFKSEVSAVVIMSLAFGLAHAPGFIFRQAGEIEGLGTNPNALDAMAYAIATLSVAGILFGVIWARTKNLVALIIIHAAADLLPNVTPFVKTWL